MLVRVYSYIRFSHTEQRKGNSLARQTRQAEEWCQERGYTLDTALSMTDLGVSAFRGANALAGLGTFLEAIRLGKVAPGSILLVESLDRLSRDQMTEALSLFMGILRAGVDIVTFSPERRYSKQSINEGQIGILEPILIFIRAHEESATKSHRGRAAWDAKRSKAKDTPLTACCPSWLKLGDKGKFELLPERAATVRLIFEWSINGMGHFAITKRLHELEIPNITRGAEWNYGYVAKLLRNREVMGEFQPCTLSGKKRIPSGPPIAGYYPAVVTEAEFYQAQLGLEMRRMSPGRTGKLCANIFQGLIKDARDGCSVVATTKGNRRWLVSSGAMRGRKGSLYIAHQYEPIEKAFLIWIQELTVADVNGGNKSHVQCAELSGRLLAIDTRITKIKQRMASAEDYEALIDVVLGLEREKREVSLALDKARAESTSSESEALGDCRMFIDLLRDTVDKQALYDLRMKIRTALRKLIKEIWVIYYLEGKHRVADMQVFFKNGEAREIHIRHGQSYVDVNLQTLSMLGRDLREYRAEGGGWFEHLVAKRGPAPTVMAQAKQMKSEGKTRQEIATALGVSRRSVSRYLK